MMVKFLISPPTCRM